LLIAIQIIQIILSVTLTVLVLLQVKGGGLGSIFGGDGGVYRTRRGIEKSMYQATIALAIIFFAMSLISVSFSFNLL
jgi:preprotein translocase subunit SecG